MAWSGSFDTFIEVMSGLLHYGSVEEKIDKVECKFSGQPRRHLLTTGWSIFVSQKNLVSGDAVLFLRYVGLFGSHKVLKFLT